MFYYSEVLLGRQVGGLQRASKRFSVLAFISHHFTVQYILFFLYLQFNVNFRFVGKKKKT
jgi:hypothetical protein